MQLGFLRERHCMRQGARLSDVLAERLAAGIERSSFVDRISFLHFCQTRARDPRALCCSRPRLSMPACGMAAAGVPRRCCGRRN